MWILLSVGIAQLIVIAALVAYLLSPRLDRHIELIAARLAAEQRVDTVTRATLQAMRETARRQFIGHDRR